MCFAIYDKPRIGFLCQTNKITIMRSDTICITAGTLLLAAAFIVAVGLPKMFFLLLIASNLFLCLGVDWIANINHDYPVAYLVASIATLTMGLLACYDVHVAYTFIPSAIVSGYVSASATREFGGVIHGVIVCIITFLFLWVLNISLISMCSMS